MYENVREMWRANVYRCLDSWLDRPVERVWADDSTVFYADPRGSTKYVSGSQRRGERFYDTEDQAWAELLREFDEWSSNRRAEILRRGVPLPSPPVVVKRPKHKGKK